MAIVWIQSVRLCSCLPETSVHIDAVLVAGLHHSAIFSWQIKADRASSKQKGMDVIRCLFFTPPVSPSYAVFVRCRQNGGWIKIYRSSAAAAQLQVNLRARFIFAFLSEASIVQPQLCYLLFAAFGFLACFFLRFFCTADCSLHAV
jgi:hypothetical protein